jgi:hypothetical protein
MSVYSYTADGYIISGNPPEVSHLLVPHTDSITGGSKYSRDNLPIEFISFFCDLLRIKAANTYG